MSARPQIRGALISVFITLVLSVLFGRILMEFPPLVSVAAFTFGFAGLVALPEEDRLAIANRVRETLDILQIPYSKAAELYMDWSYRDFNRALAGEIKLDWWRLVMMGPEFRRVYAMLELRDLGLPEFAQTALKVDSALSATKRPA